MITVVSAAIVAVVANRVLLTQRSGGTSYPFMACTPGGKVNPGESNLDALWRELGEEIGLVGAPKELPEVYRHAMTSSRTGEPVTVICYRLDWHGNLFSFSCLDATIGLWWHSAGDLLTADMAPADNANREKLIALVA